MGNRVGAFISRSTPGPLGLGNDAGPALKIALTAERGPVNVPQLITSLSNFRRVFGEATPTSSGTEYSEGFEFLKAYFSTGGRLAWVTRIVGASATASSVTLADRAGSPEDTLKVDFKGPGAWADGFDVVIAAGTRTNTFKLTLLDDVDDVLETWDNLKMDDASIARVNAGSVFLVLTDLASATAAPDNRPAEGTTTIAVATHGGADDNAPAASVIVGTDVSGAKTGLKSFRDRRYGYGFGVAPGLDSDATVKAELIEQGESFFNLAPFAVTAGQAPAAALTERGNIDAFNAQLYYPRPKVVDELTGSRKAITPVGHILGRYIKALAEVGPGKVAGGAAFDFPGVVGWETQSNGQPLIDEAVAELLLASNVNPIWDRDGSGYRLWGARAATDEDAWKFMHAGALWCRIGHAIKTTLDGLALDLADDLFFARIEGGIWTYLDDLYDQGAFSGNRPVQGQPADVDADAFFVQCDASLLSDADRDNGNVRVSAWFRPALVAETILVDLAKF
jgi:phage tail sheath protein FI